jgi:hypothetical protein
MDLGVGSIILITRLAWDIVQKCRDASKEFKDLSRDVKLIAVSFGLTKELLSNRTLTSKSGPA